MVELSAYPMLLGVTGILMIHPVYNPNPLLSKKFGQKPENFLLNGQTIGL
jgi:hypothetical protein